MGTVRSNTKRAAVVLTVLGVLLCVALFVRAYQSAAPPDTQGQAGRGPTGTPSPSRARMPSVDAVMPTRLPPATYTIAPAEHPGFVFAGPSTHRLVMTVTSAAPIPAVGYLVPTSPDHSYGTAKHLSTRWSVTTTVTGGPNYALLFVQADASGTPITCSITVDGVVRDHRSTRGPYGRQVCVG
ncbi:MAG: hypothetical protein ACRDWT_07600 [Jatrophihabitantaceae bacterium]